MSDPQVKDLLRHTRRQTFSEEPLFPEISLPYDEHCGRSLSGLLQGSSGRPTRFRQQQARAHDLFFAALFLKNDFAFPPVTNFLMSTKKRWFLVRIEQMADPCHTAPREGDLRDASFD